MHRVSTLEGVWSYIRVTIYSQPGTLDPKPSVRLLAGGLWVAGLRYQINELELGLLDLGFERFRLGFRVCDLAFSALRRAGRFGSTCL